MKIQIELNGPEPIVVKAFIPPITFAQPAFIWTGSRLRRYERLNRKETILPRHFKAFSRGSRFLWANTGKLTLNPHSSY